MPQPSLAKIAEDTLAAVAKGTYVDSEGTSHSIDDLSNNSNSATGILLPRLWHNSQTQFLLCKNSTLEGVRQCAPLARKIGVLNFASATRPGGGFLGGARAQEESIARSSNLYASLTTPAGQRFYATHKSDPTKNKYYSHAMVYTRGVQLFRSDDGEWVAPATVDVLTSAAVNAGEVRKREGGREGGGINAYFKPARDQNRAAAPAPVPADVETTIEDVMRERMGRLLFLFEKEGAQDLVLGSFGTGVFKNKVPMVARLWVELLAAPDARFRNSFQRVVFAIIDQKTCAVFKEVFNSLNLDFIESGT
ncbi:hypothetical protein B0H11DRAFT_1987543 [Mycena galericulata]|nr:hypothetical protein B0H11DRAFT_1987543 [Mycena galericulata]